MKNLYDVTIAGAGPAGSVLAYELARKGIKVLLLEKDKLPRSKVCAGGITVRATSLLPFNFNEIVENVIQNVRLSFRTHPQKLLTYDKPLAYMVMRSKFDYMLASGARAEGAILKDEVELRNIQVNEEKITVQTSQDIFSTRILVGADGANSAVVRSLGIRNGFEFGVGLNGHIPVTNETWSLWDGIFGLDYGIPGGYAWVFPKRQCLAVGAGGSFREAKKLRYYTLQLVQAYGLGNIDGRNISGHLMPMKKSSTPLAYGRVLLVGDAAGVIDPLTGEGIYYGLKTSYLAAEVILKFLEGKADNLKEYDEAVNRDVMPELKIARTIQKLNSATPRIFFHYLRDDPRFWRAFCGLLRGERTYVGLKSRLRAPLRLLFRVI